ncbi:MAG: VCBS repeat-containing protein, partial [Gammaproteobacteria bacterium]|nr:VCBS repeat-containing protein [Gammaproteobacteria bacterium]
MDNIAHRHYLKRRLADLNGDGADEVILAGLVKNGNKFRVGVVANTGKNVTSKYIRPNKVSTEAPQVYDLNNDGKDDVIFWGGTDSDTHAPSYVYLSKKKGAHTRKMITPKVWYHGSGQGDLDGDGKEDFVGTGYGGKGKHVVSYRKKLLIRKLKYTGSKC